MIRTVWVYLVGGLVTLLLGAGVVIRTYLWRRDLPLACDRTARRWASAILWAAGAKVFLEGSEHLEDAEAGGARILASNHESWFDVFALAAHLPLRYRFVAKKELEDVPVFGRAWKSCGHVSVDRADREAAIESLDTAWEEVRKEGLAMVLFPEGTRSPDGRLGMFEKGAFVLAIQGQVPLVPVAVLGSRKIMPKGRLRVRPGSIHIRIGSPIPTDGLDFEDRDQLLRVCWEAIARLKGEERGFPAPDSSPAGA